MKIQFAGITEFSGPSGKVQDRLDALQDANVGNVTARSDFHQGRAVLLTGKDADVFFKQFYNVELPAEFKGKSKEEAEQIVTQNPQKYTALIQKFTEIASNVFKFLDNVFQYLDACKASGKDAEGNAIQQEVVQ